MDDIVTRLREHAKPKDWHTPKHPMNDWVGRWATDRLCEQAADEIERLRAAGDALAEMVAVRLPLEGDWADYVVPYLRTWKEARRG